MPRLRKSPPSLLAKPSTTSQPQLGNGQPISFLKCNLSTQPPDNLYPYSDFDNNNNSNNRCFSDVKLYSCFKKQLLAIGHDHDTYCRDLRMLRIMRLGN